MAILSPVAPVMGVNKPRTLNIRWIGVGRPVDQSDRFTQGGCCSFESVDGRLVVGQRSLAPPRSRLGQLGPSGLNNFQQLCVRLGRDGLSRLLLAGQGLDPFARLRLCGLRLRERTARFKRLYIRLPVRSIASTSVT
jgi:hypothetical protein